MSYLDSLGPAALPALQKLLSITNANKNILIDLRPASQEISDTHNRIVGKLENTQSNWRTWTLRGLMLEAQ